MKNGFLITDNLKNKKEYDGNTFKFGITVDKEDYIAKFAKDSLSSLYSEYVASNFICNLGIPCQEVYLGTYNRQLAVIIKDFATKDSKLRSYKSTQQSSEDTDIENKNYTYQDVLDMIQRHTKMSNKYKQQAIKLFWLMFICDAILGNRDRHHGNWGYLKEKPSYRPAPIYDNGASLFPDVERNIDRYKMLVQQNKEFEFIAERSEKFPASVFQMERADGKIKKTNYYEILSDLRVNKILAQEVRYFREKIGFSRIYEAIFRSVYSADTIIPYYYKRFYIMVTCVRYLHMIERKDLKTAYKITKQKFDSDVRLLR